MKQGSGPTPALSPLQGKNGTTTKYQRSVPSGAVWTALSNILPACHAMQGQEYRGTVAGLVTDASGAAVLGVEVASRIC